MKAEGWALSNWTMVSVVSLMRVVLEKPCKRRTRRHVGNADKEHEGGQLRRGSCVYPRSWSRASQEANRFMRHSVGSFARPLAYRMPNQLRLLNQSRAI